MNKIIELKNLNKSFIKYNVSTNVLNNINLDIYEEEWLSLVGPSGCGKSTLLNIIAKLDISSSGLVTYNKANLVIGYMFQEDALLPWLTVQDNALLGLKINNKITEERLKYVNKLLTEYGLKDFVNKYPHELSGGMRQRVALIRTMALKPNILLLDEPFSALDYQTRIKIADDVKKIAKEEKITVVMVTHDIAEAISLSNRVVILTKRPCQIKDIIELEFAGNLICLDRRKDIKFNNYYEKIWQEIDVSI